MIYDLLVRNPFRRWFLILLIIVNILGSAYGYYWYSGQLMITPKELWLFTFDSPFSTTLFVLVLVLMLFGIRSKFLQLIAYTSLIKYGLWASIVIVDYWVVSGNVTYITGMLLLSHVGMAVEGLIFIRHLYVPVSNLLIMAGWFALNDYLDYIVGIYPFLYYEGQVTIAAISALLLSILLIVYVWRCRLEKRRFIFRSM